MTERWLPVVGYEDLYEVSSLGKVCSYKSGRDRPLKGNIDRYGYHSINLSRCGRMKRRRMHTIVCEAFHGERPAGAECRHLSGDKSDNSESNLAWGTKSENAKDQVRHGKHTGTRHLVRKYGERHHSVKYSDELVAMIRSDAANGLGSRTLGRKYGIKHSYVHQIITGKTRSNGTTVLPQISKIEDKHGK